MTQDAHGVVEFRTALKVPGLQASHSDMPVIAPYDPAKHVVQTGVPVVFAKVPAAHFVQPVVELDSFLNLPSAQASHAVIPESAPKVPEAQTGHTDVPSALAKLPAAH